VKLAARCSHARYAFYKACLGSRVVYADGPQCPSLTTFYVSLRVKYRCFIFQLNTGETRFNIIHICVFLWKNRRMTNIRPMLNLGIIPDFRVFREAK
jgi:hypothetical protein